MDLLDRWKVGAKSGHSYLPYPFYTKSPSQEPTRHGTDVVPERSLRGETVALRDGRCCRQGAHLVKACQAHLEHPAWVAQERLAHCGLVCGGGIERTQRMQPRTHAANSEPLVRARCGDGQQVHVGLKQRLRCPGVEREARHGKPSRALHVVANAGEDTASLESILQEHVRARDKGALVRREGGVDLRRQHDGALVWQLGARDNILPRRRRPFGMSRL